MEREPAKIKPDDDLESVLQVLQSDPGCPLLVLEGDTLRGMLTFENLAEFIVIARRLPTV